MKALLAFLFITTEPKASQPYAHCSTTRENCCSRGSGNRSGSPQAPALPRKWAQLEQGAAGQQWLPAGMFTPHALAMASWPCPPRQAAAATAGAHLQRLQGGGGTLRRPPPGFHTPASPSALLRKSSMARLASPWATAVLSSGTLQEQGAESRVGMR